MPEATAAEAPRSAMRSRQGGGALVVVAHPDDEVFVSGTLCLFADAGLPIKLIALTDGESGGAGSVPLGRGEGVADIRRRELARSAQVLGAAEPTFLHQPDVADPERAWDRAFIIARVAQAISAMQPSIVLSHGPRGGYGHPAHQLTYRCVMEAVAQSEFPGAVFSFCAQVPGSFFSWHFDEASTVRIDVRGFEARRVACLACHETQRDYFLQPYLPRTVRKHLSALFGHAFSFTAAGRKRVPIATPGRFFARFPVEGLSLQRPRSDGRPHLFFERFCDDDRVRIDR